jgi:anaerobic magnesium-protoporphyrin IX monomethyl ester cyclase
MNVALINPPFLFPCKEEFVFSQCIGLRSLSSFLKIKGRHEVHFIDGLMLGFSDVRTYANGYMVGLTPEEIVARIPRETELIGISVPFSQLAPIAHDLADRAKARFPDSVVVMGGVYPSTQPRLALTSRADLIVVGEGEHALLEIANGRNHKEIRGVYSHGSSENEDFPSTRIIDDLDTLPLPDYSIPQIDTYFSLSPRSQKGRVASLFTSRGCPFDCEFCSIHPVYGRQYRSRSAANVLDEIKYLVERHAIRSLEIEDDNFTLKKERTADILKGIVRLNEQGAHLGWRTPNGIRIDTLDEEMIRLIKESNCREIVLALEHGDSKMLQIMNKRLDLDKVYTTIEQLIRYKIPKITLFVIVGYPGETKERFLSGLSFLDKIRKLGGNTSLWVSIAQPYPGTKLLARCRMEGYITDEHFDNFLNRRDLMSTGYTVWIQTPDFDAEEVRRRKAVLLDSFDHTPKWKIMTRRFVPPQLIGLFRLIRSFLSHLLVSFQ